MCMYGGGAVPQGGVGDRHLVTVPQEVVGDRLPWGGERQGGGGGGYGKYGLYNNNGVLTCGPCGQRLDYTRDDVTTTHITRDGHDRKCVAQISHGAQYVLAAGYEERENLRRHKATQAKERAEQRRNPSHSTQLWDKEREKKYSAQLTTKNRAKREAF